MGGIEPFVKVMSGYAVDQSRPESIVLGAGFLNWLRQVNRLMIWNALGVITWVWAIPFGLKNKPAFSVPGRHVWFFVWWLLPGLIIQALIHVAAPGHALFSVCALCLAGGYVVSRVREKELVLASALVLNVMLFLDYLPLPAEAAATAPLERVPSLKNAFLFGVFESSLGWIRWQDDVAAASLREIEEFTPKDRPSTIITTDKYEVQWFMNWRIARYYLPNREITVLYHIGTVPGWERIRRDAVLQKTEGVSLKLPLIQNGRVLWLIEPQSPVFRKLDAAYKLQGGPYVFYTDVTESVPAINLDGVEIVSDGVQ